MTSASDPHDAAVGASAAAGEAGAAGGTVAGGAGAGATAAAGAGPASSGRREARATTRPRRGGARLAFARAVRRRLRERAVAARQLVGLLRRARRSSLAALVGVHTLAGLAPLGFVLAVAQAVGAAAAGRGAGGWLALAAVSFLLGQLAAPLQAHLSAQVAREVDAWCSEELIRLALLRAPLQALEDDRVAAELHDVGESLTLQRLTPGMAAEAAVALIARYLPMLGAVALLAGAVGPWPALLVLALALGSRLAQSEGFVRWGRVVVDLRALRRRVGYVRELATGTRAAKEIRTLGLIGWLDERYRRDHTALTTRLRRRRRTIFGLPSLLVAGLGLLATVGALGAVATAVAADVAAAGVGASTDAAALGRAVTAAVIAVQAVTLCVRFGVMFGESDVKLVYGRAAWAAKLRAEELSSSLAPDPARPGVEAPPAVPVRREVPRPEHELRLSKVTFTYPGAPTPVLNGLDLAVRAGTSLAVVGANGAGKTTLIKLITGLYPPTSGRVLADGADVAWLDRRAWQARFAVTFQDFVRYPTSLRENVAMNAVAHLDDDEGVRECLVRAGLQPLLDELDAAGEGAGGGGAGRGLDVPLTHLLPGGRDLSAGQWQRVALARALFAVRHGASILVLDEPTAALDPRGEAEFYDAFLDLTAGVTSIVVSHRFSTVRRADSIVVLEGGRVAEQGNHEELLFAGGRYARMFSAQARRFSVGGAR